MRKSRANIRGERAYLMQRIPDAIWLPAVARSTQEHRAVCGQTAIRTCPTHNMRAVLLRLLRHYGAGTLAQAAERI